MEVKSYGEETKTISKNMICETKSLFFIFYFFFFFSFLLNGITFLIPVSIYCYLIKYRAKQKHLLLFYVTNNELKEVL